MKRIPLRRLFRLSLTLAALLSTLCGLAIAALCLDSRFEPSRNFSLPENISLFLYTNGFRLSRTSEEIIIDSPITPPGYPSTRPYTHIYHIDSAWPTTYLGFSFGHQRTLTGIQYEPAFNRTRYINTYFVFAPYWLSLPLLLGFPILLARRSLRRPRNPTLCPTCAYDLRAHSPGTNCPECGAPVAPALPVQSPPARKTP